MDLLEKVESLLKLGKLAPFPADKVLEQGLQHDSSARAFLPKDKLCDLDGQSTFIARYVHFFLDFRSIRYYNTFHPRLRGTLDTFWTGE